MADSETRPLYYIERSQLCQFRYFDYIIEIHEYFGCTRVTILNVSEQISHQCDGCIRAGQIDHAFRPLNGFLSLLKFK